jgi:hypothetical protein
VEPRGFEPLTSAVQSRHDTLLQISGVCETAASTRIPHTTLFLGFRDIHSGCCTVAAQKGPGAKPVPHPCLPLLLPPRALGLNMRICPASAGHLLPNRVSTRLSSLLWLQMPSLDPKVDQPVAPVAPIVHGGLEVVGGLAVACLPIGAVILSTDGTILRGVAGPESAHED